MRYLRARVRGFVRVCACQVKRGGGGGEVLFVTYTVPHKHNATAYTNNGALDRLPQPLNQFCNMCMDNRHS